MTIYAHMSLDEKRKALSKLGEALGRRYNRSNAGVPGQSRNSLRHGWPQAHLPCRTSRLLKVRGQGENAYAGVRSGWLCLGREGLACNDHADRGVLCDLSWGTIWLRASLRLVRCEQRVLDCRTLDVDSAPSGSPEPTTARDRRPAQAGAGVRLPSEGDR
jgi:hypothetical protein